MDNIVKVVNLKKIFLKISASSKVVGRQGVPKEKKKKNGSARIRRKCGFQVDYVKADSFRRAIH